LRQQCVTRAGQFALEPRTRRRRGHSPTPGRTRNARPIDVLRRAAPRTRCARPRISSARFRRRRGRGRGRTGCSDPWRPGTPPRRRGYSSVAETE
jgi:hypothetical protein